MIAEMNDFVALILSHGRPDRVLTYDTLRRQGYTGKIRIVIDDQDKKADDYKRNFKDEVIVFSKKEIAKTFDQADNSEDMRAIVYARNASFNIARDLKCDFFIQLDDDYKSIDWRFDDKLNYCHRKMNASLDAVFSSLLKFFKSVPQCKSIALAQGGDYIGGASSGICFGDGRIGLHRKCMNSFICSTQRPFSFVGRINEDVNTYTYKASIGHLFFTSNQVALEQLQTQSNAGGMTDLYRASGTYVKSFYSVIFQPSSVKIMSMGFTNRRLHHNIDWKTTVPKILCESVRKSTLLTEGVSV